MRSRWYERKLFDLIRKIRPQLADPDFSELARLVSVMQKDVHPTATMLVGPTTPQDALQSRTDTRPAR